MLRPCVSYHMPKKKLGSVLLMYFFRRAVGIHSNWRMIITHAVMPYIGLQEGLHNIKLCLSSLLFRELETNFPQSMPLVCYLSFLDLNNKLLWLEWQEQAISLWNRLILSTVLQAQFYIYFETRGPLVLQTLTWYLDLGFYKISLPGFFQKWPWTSTAQLIVCIYQLSGHRLQWFLKNPQFSIFPIEKPKLPNFTLP